MTFLNDLFAELWSILMTIQTMVGAWAAALGLVVAFAVLPGCELPSAFQPEVHQGLHIDDASTSELVQALIELGFDRFEGVLGDDD